MRYEKHKYTSQPADTVPRWAVGKLSGSKTVLALWTPGAFRTLALGRLLGKRNSSAILTPKGVIR